MSVEPADPLQEARLGILSAVMHGDAGLAYDLVSGLLADGIPFDTILFEIIAPLQVDVGRRWQQGDYGIAQEHASTSAIETLVALLAGSFEQPEDAEHVVVACADGDVHSLPPRMVAAYLLYLGRRVTFLGSSVPADDLAVYLTELRPAALVLSCAIVTRLRGARASIAAAHSAGVPVIAGGRGFGDGDAIAVALGADAWAGHPTHIDRILASWRPDVAAAESGVVEPDPTLAVLEDRRPALIGAAVERSGPALPAGAGAPLKMRLREDFRLLFDGVVAGLLLRRQDIVVDVAMWHGNLLAGTHFGHTTTPLLVASLRDAVVDDSPTAAAYLDAAFAELQRFGAA